MNIKCKILGHKLKKWNGNRVDRKNKDIIGSFTCMRCGEIVEKKVADAHINEDHLRRLDEIIEKEEKE